MGGSARIEYAETWSSTACPHDAWPRIARRLCAMPVPRVEGAADDHSFDEEQQWEILKSIRVPGYSDWMAEKEENEQKAFRYKPLTEREKEEIRKLKELLNGNREDEVESDDEDAFECVSCEQYAQRTVMRKIKEAAEETGPCWAFGQQAGDVCPITLAVGHEPEFAREAQEVRERCMAERVDAESKAEASTTMEAMMNVVMGGRHHARPGWTKISIAVDSGAAETVIPHTLVTSHPIEATAKSRAGVCYASATGAPIPNLGQQQLPMAMAEGSLRMMTFQAAPVAKPLASVSKICMAGHVVVFDEGASYILNKTTGEINWL